MWLSCWRENYERIFKETNHGSELSKKHHFPLKVMACEKNPIFSAHNANFQIQQNLLFYNAWIWILIIYKWQRNKSRSPEVDTAFNISLMPSAHNGHRSLSNYFEKEGKGSRCLWFQDDTSTRIHRMATYLDTLTQSNLWNVNPFHCSHEYAKTSMLNHQTCPLNRFIWWALITETTICLIPILNGSAS